MAKKQEDWWDPEYRVRIKRTHKNLSHNMRRVKKERLEGQMPAEPIERKEVERAIRRKGFKDNWKDKPDEVA